MGDKDNSPRDRIYGVLPPSETYDVYCYMDKLQGTSPVLTFQGPDGQGADEETQRGGAIHHPAPLPPWGLFKKEVLPSPSLRWFI